MPFYKSIFETLEDYAKTILPLKFKVEPGSKYQDIMSEYETFENFSVGKIDERDFLEKRVNNDDINIHIDDSHEVLDILRDLEMNLKILHVTSLID